MSSNNLIFILSSPSGGGKTSTANLLLQQDSNLVRSISATTRPSRNGEVHGLDYFFLNREEFDKLCNSNQILEYATVFDHYYGTPKQNVLNVLNQGQDVLCCIDWQGATQIKGKMEVVTIFLLPPSMRELDFRLRNRSSDVDEVIAKRLAEARNEISHCNEYDYVVVNNVLDDTVKEVQDIINSERARVKNKKNLKNFIQGLVEEEI